MTVMTRAPFAWDFTFYIRDAGATGDPGEVNRYIRALSSPPQITYTIGNRATLSCQAFDPQDNTSIAYRPRVGQQIFVYRNGVPVFDGVILSVTDTPMEEPNRGVVTQIDATSYEEILDDRFILNKTYGGDPQAVAAFTPGNPVGVTSREAHRLVAGDWVAFSGVEGSSNDAAMNAGHPVIVTGPQNFTIPVTLTTVGGGNPMFRKVTPASVILEDLRVEVLSDYAISVDVDIPATTLIEKQVFERVSVTEVLRKLAGIIPGAVYRFRPDRWFEFFIVGAYRAPFSIGPAQAASGLTWSKTRTATGNQVILEYGGAVLKDIDQPFTGDGAKREFQLLYKPLQGTPLTSPGQVFSYITNDWRHVGVWGYDTLFEWVYRESDNMLVQLSEWGNGVTNWPPLQVGEGIFFRGAVQFPQTVVVPEVEPPALRQILAQDDSTTSYYAAKQIAEAILAKTNVSARRASIPLDKHQGTDFVLPGDIVAIHLPGRDIATSDWLISATSVDEEEDGLIKVSIDVIEGLVPLRSWKDDLRALFGGGGSSGGGISSSNTGSGSVVPTPPPTGGGGDGGTTVPAVFGEQPGGAVDGANTVFTTMGEYGGVLAVYLNGVRQSSPAHYVETNVKEFTMTSPPLPGDVIRVDYGDTTGVPTGGGGGSSGFTGQGTTGYLTKWTGAKAFGDSGVSEGPDYIATAVQGVEVFRLTPTAAEVKLDRIMLGPAGTASIWRDAPNVVAIRNDAAPQQFRVYNTHTVSGTNYERVTLGWFANNIELRGEQLGSGLPRNIVVRAADTASIFFSHASLDRWRIMPNGMFTAAYDNVFDIGLDAVTGRPRDIWLGRTLNHGMNLMPIDGYTSNVGAIYRKYLTIHAAELWVETLVAQYTMATIGGRILVGPTNILSRDVAPGDTFIYVKYNNFLLHVGGIEYGSKLWLESMDATGSAKFEMMIVTDYARPVAESDGSYRYTVLRNQDGSPPNQWYAGDAVMDTGKTGSGFIDLYSLRGMKSVNEAGPSIVGNVRISGTATDWRPRWAVGNLINLYGYGSTVYGAGFGDPNSNNITIDAGGPSTAPQGFRIRYGSAVQLQAVGGSLNLTAELNVGTAGVARSGATSFTEGQGWWLDFNGGSPRFRVGNPAGQRIAWDGNGNLTVVGAITVAGASAPIALADFSNVTAPYAIADGVRGSATNSNALGGVAAGTIHAGVNKANAGLDAAGNLITSARPQVGVVGVAANGLHLGADVMGFVRNGAWMTYMDSGGGFYLYGDVGHSLTWSPAGGLTVVGSINAVSGNFQGAVQIGQNGKIYSGMSTYNEGTGWILEYNNGAPRFAVGTAGGNGMTWDSANLRLQSNKVTISELGLKLHVDPNRNYLDFNSSVYWDVGIGRMGVFAGPDVWHVERDFVIENVADQNTRNETMRTILAARVFGRNAEIVCHAQLKDSPQDRIEFMSESGAYMFKNMSVTAPAADAIWQFAGIANAFYLRSDGSDERLKTNIRPFATGMNALRHVSPIAFEWLSDLGRRTVGFSAQNVLPHVPEATPLNGEHYGFYNRAMIAVIVNALKELDARLAAVEGSV